LVSSKSEIIIADALFELERAGKIRYAFERPLSDSKGGYRLPDFTIEKDQETWYWEHCGMMDSAEYVARWKQKLDWYEKELKVKVWSAGNPTGRLIVTEETRASGFDSNGTHQLIEKLFG
jgi:hypothetical protein